jgi:hypothetical protein
MMVLIAGDSGRVRACIGAAGVRLLQGADLAHRGARGVPGGALGALPQRLRGHEGGARGGHTR